jgi:hypothetical protein
METRSTTSQNKRATVSHNNGSVNDDHMLHSGPERYLVTLCDITMYYSCVGSEAGTNTLLHHQSYESTEHTVMQNTLFSMINHCCWLYICCTVFCVCVCACAVWYLGAEHLGFIRAKQVLCQWVTSQPLYYYYYHYFILRQGLTKLPRLLSNLQSILLPQPPA